MLFLTPSTNKRYELQTPEVNTLTAQHIPHILLTDFNAHVLNEHMNAAHYTKVRDCIIQDVERIVV